MSEFGSPFDQEDFEVRDYSSSLPDRQAIEKAFDNWASTKKGLPIGWLDAHTAAWQAFRGGVEWALALSSQDGDCK